MSIKRWGNENNEGIVSDILEIKKENYNLYIMPARNTRNVYV